MSLLRQCEACGKTAPNNSTEVSNKWRTASINEIHTSRKLVEKELCGDCVRRVREVLK